jgi:hypothetical protein
MSRVLLLRQLAQTSVCGEALHAGELGLGCLLIIETDDLLLGLLRHRVDAAVLLSTSRLQAYDTSGLRPGIRRKSSDVGIDS